MKKIKVINSNNKLLRDVQAPSIDLSELKLLRVYFESEKDLQGLSEFNIFINVMDWVHNQWEHDGFNDASNCSSLDILKRSRQGERFRCEEYARVTRDILISIGFIARKITILSEQFDYGGFGQSHVAVEVWSNQLNKWIFLDPQINVYTSFNNTPLSYLEVYENFNHCHFHFQNKNGQVTIQDYKEFIGQYFGYISTEARKNHMDIKIYLHLKGNKQLLTFQAMQLSRALYTTNVEDFYFCPNQTAIIFDYLEPINPIEILEKNKDILEVDIENSLHLFAVKPSFELSFLTNTPNISCFEVEINNNYIMKVETNTPFHWNLTGGINHLKVCSLNEEGINGSLTEMVIEYK